MNDDVPDWSDDEIPVFGEEEDDRPPPRKRPKLLTPELEAEILSGFPEMDPEQAVVDALAYGKNGEPLPTPLNVQTILDNDTRWDEAIRLNEFSGKVWVRIPGEEDAPMRETTHTKALLWMAQVYGINPAPTVVLAAMAVSAEANSWHPVRDYLTGLEWDKKPRVDGLLCDYFGAEDTDLTRAIARCFMVSCVARVMRPGCKADTVLVLQGGQGAGKSTACGILAKQESWFSDTPPEWHNKDLYGNMAGKWIVELAEIDEHLRGVSGSKVKATLSSRIDTYRRPYDRSPQDYPRQTVIMGSTNEPVFLEDPTGSRRFWPVTVGSIDTASLKQDVDQLWAEAFQMFVGEQPWHLSREMGRLLDEAAERFTYRDSWEPLVASYLAQRSEVTLGDVYEGALNVTDRTRWGGKSDHRLAAVMRTLGWASTRNENKARVWRRRA